MKQSIMVSMVIFIGIIALCAGESAIFASKMNVYESAFFGFFYLLFCVICNISIAKDVAYKYRKRHAIKIDQELNLLSIINDDLYLSTQERIN